MKGELSREEALAALRERGYGVVEDGGAVIVVEQRRNHEWSMSPTTATRFETAARAVRALLDNATRFDNVEQ